MPTLTMTTALWCVFISAFLPFLFTFIAKFSGARYNNYKPREFLSNLDGFRQRANWAQMNSFEIYPIFAIAVIVGLLTGGDSAKIDQLATIFIVSRVLYGLAYLANWAVIRSLLWMVGIVCSVMIFTAGPA